MTTRATKATGWVRAVQLLWRPLRMLTNEVYGVRLALTRLAELEEKRLEVEEYAVGRKWPRPAATLAEAAEVPVVDITYTTDQDQVELAEIELRLTAARGMPPTEDEIVAEYDRLRSS